MSIFKVLGLEVDIAMRTDGEVPCVTAIWVLTNQYTSNDGIYVGMTEKRVKELLKKPFDIYKTENAKIYEYAKNKHIFKIHMIKNRNNRYVVDRWGIDLFKESTIADLNMMQEGIFLYFKNRQSSAS